MLQTLYPVKDGGHHCPTTIRRLPSGRERAWGKGRVADGTVCHCQLWRWIMPVI